MTEYFKALVVRETDDRKFVRKIEECRVDNLPPGDVLIAVQYSSLNYKDALSANGNRGVTRRYPHTPGIDAAGLVAASSVPAFKPGDAVFVTGYDLGMNTPGGFGGYVRVPAGWVVPLPPQMSLRESMVYGTAGFTAGLSVTALIKNGVKPESGDILVTGASGGVGSLATALLARQSYIVTAVSGKPDAIDFLKSLGARAVIPRAEVLDTSGKALLKTRWAGVVDTVGGEMLTTAIKSTHAQGAVACCGNVASHDLHLTVYPFILRGVSLCGVNSAECPMSLRRKVWQRLAVEWKPEQLKSLADEITLNDLDDRIDRILQGGLRGRTLVRLQQD